MENMLAYCGAAKVSVTDVGLDAVAPVVIGAPLVFSFGFLLSMLKVKATSLALNALPSFHFTPDRIGRVSVLPPFDQLGGPEARNGIGAWVGFSVFQMYSGSL